MYTCKHCKMSPHRSSGYPRNYKWKTERGFNNHKCYKDEAERQAEKLVRDAEKKRIFDELFASYLDWRSGIQIGDTVRYVTHAVTKPTHQWRGSRQVKVRYEEERRYYGTTSVVVGILPAYEIIDDLRKALEDGEEYPVRYAVESGASRIRISDIVDDGADLDAAATLKQAAYDEHVEISRMCR